MSNLRRAKSAEQFLAEFLADHPDNARLLAESEARLESGEDIASRPFDAEKYRRVLDDEEPSIMNFARKNIALKSSLDEVERLRAQVQRFQKACPHLTCNAKTMECLTCGKLRQ